MADSCLFCRIASGDIPAKLAHEDDQVVAFHDINPQAPVHVLIVPRRHIGSIEDVTAEDAPLLARLVGVAQSIARATGADRQGYRLVMNHGANAGQSVPHLHLHLLAGRRLAWPPG